ncbi:MAG: hypothetical protein AAB404_01590 [Patescibacteria group bacterium]
MIDVVVRICLGLAVLSGFFGICWSIGNSLTINAENVDMGEKISNGTKIVLVLIIFLGVAWLIGWFLLEMKRLI